MQERISVIEKVLESMGFNYKIEYDDEYVRVDIDKRELEYWDSITLGVVIQGIFEDILEVDVVVG